jgi:hypothetical protein
MKPRRLRIRCQRNGLCVLTEDGEKAEATFPTLFQAVQEAQSMSDTGNVRLTVTDEKGKAGVETFV